MSIASKTSLLKLIDLKQLIVHVTNGYLKRAMTVKKAQTLVQWPGQRKREQFQCLSMRTKHIVQHVDVVQPKLLY